MVYYNPDARDWDDAITHGLSFHKIERGKMPVLAMPIPHGAEQAMGNRATHRYRLQDRATGHSRRYRGRCDVVGGMVARDGKGER